MSSESLISGLVAAAEPVSIRRRRYETLALLAVALIQITGAVFFFGLSSVSANISSGGAAMIFKLIIFGWLAVSASWLTLRAYDPATPLSAMRLLIPLGAALLLALIGLDRQFSGGSFLQTVNPAHGVRCIFSLVSLALPTTLLLSLLMIRGAPTHPDKTALLVGLSGGSWGAFTYALQCPYVSLWYLGIWYLAGIVTVTVLARLILPHVTRW